MYLIYEGDGFQIKGIRKVVRATGNCLVNL